jgi:Uma2 family endonuclease
MSRAVETAQRRFTVEEYHRMAETGILGPDERVELVRGVIRRMSPKNWAHVITTKVVLRTMENALRGRASVYQAAPLVAREIDSEPEPDVLVCSNPDELAYGSPRTRPVLVIEVAESSLDYDLVEKAAIYAAAGVPEYWIVNLKDRRLAVFREPRSAGYQGRFSVEEKGQVTTEAWPDLSFDVSAFLPRETPAPPDELS